LGVGLIGWLAITLYVRDLTNPDNIVAKIEASLNCRAEIKEASLNIFESPVRMQVTGLALGERDEFAKPDVKLADRPKLNAAVSVDTIFVELEAMPLLSKKLIVNDFAIERPNVKVRVYEDGNTSLDELFRPPPGAVVATGGEAAPVAPASDERPPRFTADQLPVAAMAKEVSLEDGTIYATIDKTKYTMLLDRAIIRLIDIDIDPNALEEHNSSTVEISLNVSVDSLRHNQRFVELAIDGIGAVQPFDPISREFAPSLSASVTVERSSYIEAMPMLDEIEDWIEKLESYGVGLDGVRLRGDFSEDTTLSFNANRDQISMTDDFLVPIDENFLIIKSDSWVKPGENDHDFKVSFVASERLTKKAEDEAEKYLAEKVGAAEARIAKELLFSKIKKDGFLVLNFQSQGDFGSPKVVALDQSGAPLATLLDTSPDEAADQIKEKFNTLLDSLIDEVEGDDEGSSEEGEMQEQPQPEAADPPEAPAESAPTTEPEAMPEPAPAETEEAPAPETEPAAEEAEPTPEPAPAEN